MRNCNNCPVSDCALNYGTPECQTVKNAYIQGKSDGYSQAEKDYFAQSQKDREDTYNCGYEIGKSEIIDKLKPFVHCNYKGKKFLFVCAEDFNNLSFVEHLVDVSRKADK